MPEIKYYTVKQTRLVKVAANNALDAAHIASAAFEHGQDSSKGLAKGKGPEGIWGNTTDFIRETSLEVKEDWI